MTDDELLRLAKIVEDGLSPGRRLGTEAALDEIVTEVRRLSVNAELSLRRSIDLIDAILAEREACAIAVQDLDAEAAAVIRARGEGSR